MIDCCKQTDQLRHVTKNTELANAAHQLQTFTKCSESN